MFDVFSSSVVGTVVCEDGTEVEVYTDHIPNDESVRASGRFVTNGFRVIDEVVNNSQGGQCRVKQFLPGIVVSDRIVGRLEQQQLGLYCPNPWSWDAAVVREVRYTIEVQQGAGSADSL